ncbi:TY-Chap domain-containing protein [Nocardia lijiangensis]|uniref:TY-Chap domain-containing protein n=1 Tax=Nocardia lijiangensis TaxID=299618 RepID=UPI000832CD9E|nr:hypothetical protein [Nocardia lijiangensis]
MAIKIPDWPSLSAALALTLARMPGDGCLILSATGNRFAQFVMGSEGLWAEIVDDSALVGGYRISPDDAVWLSSHGWSPPSEAGSPNWHRRVPWPAHYNEYEAIADQVVEVLCEVLRISAPTELTVESWVNFSNDKFDVSALG